MYENSSLSCNHFRFYAGCRVTVNRGAKLYLGSGYMNYNGVLECYDTITIGNNVKIADNVFIRDSDGHNIIREGYSQSQPIINSDNCWIGLNCTILKGTELGEGCIVAAGSVLNGKYPPPTALLEAFQQR